MPNPSSGRAARFSGGAPGAGTSSAQTWPRSVCGHSTCATQTSPAIASRQCSKYEAGSGASRIRSPTKTSSTVLVPERVSGKLIIDRPWTSRPGSRATSRATTADDIPEAALEAAKRSLLDAIGVSVAASGLAPECLPFVRLARAEGAAPVCSMLGLRRAHVARRPRCSRTARSPTRSTSRTRTTLRSRIRTRRPSPCCSRSRSRRAASAAATFSRRRPSAAT